MHCKEEEEEEEQQGACGSIATGSKQDCYSRFGDCCGRSCEEEQEEESSKGQDGEEEQQGGGALMKLFIEVELGPDEISLATELFRTMRYVYTHTMGIVSSFFVGM